MGLIHIWDYKHCQVKTLTSNMGLILHIGDYILCQVNNTCFEHGVDTHWGLQTLSGENTCFKHCQVKTLASNMGLKLHIGDYTHLQVQQHLLPTWG
jgi:hypothetical protein